MLELYSTLNPSAILFLIVLSVFGVIVQTLCFSVVAKSKTKKTFEFLVGGHLFFVSLIFRKLSTAIGDVVILAEMYSTMRLIIAVFILILGLYIFLCERNCHIISAIVLVLMTLPIAERLPYGIYTFCFIFSLLALMFRATILYIIELKKQKTEITEHSIKEALDTQHSGILFAEKEGTVLLINKQMLYLMKEITGKNHRNAKNFWNTINISCYASSDSGAKDSGACSSICRLGNSSWQFLKKEIFYRGKEIYQITATDVTEQETINRKLEDYGNQLREQQEQLNIALMNLEELGREEAISRSWDYIHGVLGQHISVLQRLFAQEPPLDIEGVSLLIEELQKDLVIREENPDEIYRGLMSSFISLGINLHREGKFPEDDKISNLFIEIIREGATNALRHGQANNIYLILSDGEKHTLTMTNDGVFPPEHIVWGGGLHSIYNKVKELGGNLIISTRPEFSLYAEIPG